jgi:hypothetical protein
MIKHSVTLDERGKRILRQTSTILYIITIYSLIGIQLYRQFVLNQPSEEWNDMASCYPIFLLPKGLFAGYGVMHLPDQLSTDFF